MCGTRLRELRVWPGVRANPAADCVADMGRAGSQTAPPGHPEGRADWRNQDRQRQDRDGSPGAAAPVAGPPLAVGSAAGADSAGPPPDRGWSQFLCSKPLPGAGDVRPTGHGTSVEHGVRMAGAVMNPRRRQCAAASGDLRASGSEPAG